MAIILSAAVVVHLIIAGAVITSVLRQRREPAAMLAWIFAAVTLPALGALLYVLLVEARIQRKASRRRRRVAHLLSRLRRQAERSAGASATLTPPHLPAELAAIEALGRRLVQIPAIAGNEVEVYDEAEATFKSLEQAIRSAEHHVHLLYYIWQPDETGRFFRDLLIERARDGIECRVLLDAVGSMRLRRRFYQPMVEVGVQTAFFLPLQPLRRRPTLHLRNHRKVAVIDGNTAFLGSQNIGDEYRGLRKRLSPWYDSHMRIRGPAALFCQQAFAEDWLFATRHTMSDEYFGPAPQRGDCVVQVLPTGPEQDISVLAQMLFAAVAEARRTIRIATPYFVPDPALRMALVHASCRGVHVELVISTRSDAPLALWAGRSFYGELLEAGVEVYEYDEGVLHSKIMSVDDRWCMLGSANMDVRSFRLNFEITGVVYDQGVAARISAVISRFRKRARRVTPEALRDRGAGAELLEGAARLFAPLL